MFIFIYIFNLDWCEYWCFILVDPLPDLPFFHFSLGKNFSSFKDFSVNHNVFAVLSHSVVSDSLWPHGLQSARLLCPWGFSRQEYWSGLPCLPRGNLPNPRDWTQVSCITGWFFTVWATREASKAFTIPNHVRLTPHCCVTINFGIRISLTPFYPLLR